MYIKDDENCYLQAPFNLVGLMLMMKTTEYLMPDILAIFKLISELNSLGSALLLVNVHKPWITALALHWQGATK